MVVWKPAYPPRASAMVASENRRPTFRGSASFTVMRRWAVACSLVGASAESKRSSLTSVASNESRPPSRPNSSSVAQAALASTSSPVSTSVIVLR